MLNNNANHRISLNHQAANYKFHGRRTGQEPGAAAAPPASSASVLLEHFGDAVDGSDPRAPAGAGQEGGAASGDSHSKCTVCHFFCPSVSLPSFRNSAGRRALTVALSPEQTMEFAFSRFHLGLSCVCAAAACCHGNGHARAAATRGTPHNHPVRGRWGHGDPPAGPRWDAAPHGAVLWPCTGKTPSCKHWPGVFVIHPESPAPRLTGR